MNVPLSDTHTNWSAAAGSAGILPATKTQRAAPRSLGAPASQLEPRKALCEKSDEPAVIPSARPAQMTDADATPRAPDGGDPPAAAELLALVYDELRRLAAHKLSHEAPGHTLQPTALVNEAWLRLVTGDTPKFANRAHFFSLAAEAMRRILIDRARRKQAQRRGGNFERVEFDGLEIAAPGPDDQLLAVNEALDRFAKTYPVQAELVKLRYFTGLTIEETAQILEISVSTAKNYWSFSRAWLFKEITP